MYGRFRSKNRQTQKVETDSVKMQSRKASEERSTPIDTY